jgi:ABC-type branched-subunit amino acid transport system permease subunit
VILGAVVFIALPELLREAARYRMLAFGLAMVTLALVRPQGLLGRAWVGEERDEPRTDGADVAPGLPSQV